MAIPVEPPAELRQVASAMFQLFQAYQQAGFSETQAFRLVETQVEAMAKGASGGSDS